MYTNIRYMKKNSKTLDAIAICLLDSCMRSTRGGSKIPGT